MLKALAADRKALTLTIKVSAAQLDAIQEKAREFAGGNISAWVRFSAMNFAPRSSQLEAKHEQARKRKS